jgi:preprotein translocase subunit SecG
MQQNHHPLIVVLVLVLVLLQKQKQKQNLFQLVVPELEL